LRFFGGVPEVAVPDNLKAGVKSPCRYEPDINPTYQEWAEHNRIAVVPTRVRKPRDKALTSYCTLYG
jgi:transposase